MLNELGEEDEAPDLTPPSARDMASSAWVRAVEDSDRDEDAVDVDVVVAVDRRYWGLAVRRQEAQTKEPKAFIMTGVAVLVLLSSLSSSSYPSLLTTLLDLVKVVCRPESPKSMPRSVKADNSAPTAEASRVGQATAGQGRA